MHHIFTEHNVVKLSFVICMLVFFIARKAIFKKLDSGMEKAQKSLDESQKIKNEAMLLLEQSKREYEASLEKNQMAIQHAKRKAEKNIEEGREAIIQNGRAQMAQIEAKMEKERREQIAQLNQSIISQTKILLESSLKELTDSQHHHQNIEDVKAFLEEEDKKHH
jgi:F0F1-type ATP synthase membrane subunit b/b'